VGTSGRAVVFAAVTVIIALLGLFVMRISFFNGLALAAAGTVLLVMLSAVWLLPALLSLLSDRAVQPLSRLLHIKALYRLTRHARRQGDFHPDSNAWASYGRLLQRRPIVPLVLSLGVVVVLAIPVFSLRLGFPDDSGQPVGSLARTAYDLSAEGFGAGSNGPFLVAVQLPSKGDTVGLAATVKALEDTPGVASTLPNSAMVPLLAAGLANQTITAIQVVPSTGPQDLATTDLLHTLRDTSLPAVDAATGAKAYVGGQTAIVADFSTVLSDALPLFLGLVVGLGFLALLMLFRAALVSLTAVLTSLLSFAASMGITVAVFQWGWADSLLGISGTGPIFPFLPVMVFSILFGLSMDYQVFLVSRMQEEWAVHKDNSLAVRRGLGGSGRVVLMAALIMASVFAAFIPTPGDTIKLFGVALTSAVLVDAFLIRLVFVPSLMTLLGKSNWWLPGWLHKVLPHVSVEGSETPHVAEPGATDEVPDPNLETSAR
jgi:RND superfamily putative drug exporter